MQYVRISILSLLLLGILHTNTKEPNYPSIQNISFMQCVHTIPMANCLEGFYKIPDFFIFKGAYVYVFAHKDTLLAYGVANLDNSAPRQDKRNPDKNLRQRSDKGVIFLNIAINGAELQNGTSYNFQDGMTYKTRGKILANGDLHMEFSLDPYYVFGKGLIWSRLNAKQIEDLGLKAWDKEEVLKTLKSK